MSSRIVNLRIKNFKCFDNSKFYEFKIDGRKNPIILSGPNGFGKTTFFDAIEIMFSNQITRLEKQIESKKTNLGKNLLLNELGADGFIVLTLQDENLGYTTLLGKILKEKHNIEVEKSIVYGVIKRFVATTDLEVVLANYNKWSEEPTSDLRYRKNDFNVYYYISQAESVHFLKRSIQDRKNAMNVLLKTDSVDKKREMVTKLIGKNTNASTPINNAIKTVNADIDSLVQECKMHMNNNNSFNKKIDNVKLNLYSQDKELFYWDNPEIDKTSVDNIKSAETAVERIYYYAVNENDFKNKRKNIEIESINTHEVINDYVLYRQYIKDSKVCVENINEDILAIDKKIQIFNSAQLFITKNPPASLYDERDILKLKGLVPDLAGIDFSLISELAQEIVGGEKSLSNTETIISKLESARRSLREVNENYASTHNKLNICPYCNTVFKSENELNEEFENVGDLLKKESGNEARRIIEIKEKFYGELGKISPLIIQYIENLDKNKIDRLNLQKTKFQRFVNDSNRIRKVEKMTTYLKKSDFNSNVNADLLETEIQRTLSNLLVNISNPEFDNISNLYDFYGLSKQYGEVLPQIIHETTPEKLFQKKEYLASLVSKLANAKTVEYKEKIKELIVRKTKLERARTQLNKLGKIYDTKLDTYKKMTLEKLRIPLLIYTGKILQDYQNGLGVFIDQDEMRFVSNGDAKHDILNTFSSGQLSGFVMAFLFAMNKQYIKKSSDDVGFILIDDPVQTMDDINIASLIEVMRNDFADKQIILSTHEVDKENYILYKFLKYNLIGQSFNVKENLYNI